MDWLLTVFQQLSVSKHCFNILILFFHLPSWLTKSKFAMKYECKVSNYVFNMLLVVDRCLTCQYILCSISQTRRVYERRNTLVNKSLISAPGALFGTQLFQRLLFLSSPSPDMRKEILFFPKEHNGFGVIGGTAQCWINDFIIELLCT